MRSLICLLLLAFALPASADDALLALFDEPDQMTLYSVEPGVYSAWGYGRGFKAPETPYGTALAALEEWDGVYGALPIGAADERKAIGAAIRKGFGAEGPVASCYQPRHALVVVKDGKPAIMHICFQCHYAVLLGPQTPKGRYTSFQAGALKGRLNGLLKAAKIHVDGQGPKPASGPRFKGDLGVAAEKLAWLAQPDEVVLYRIDPSHWTYLGKGEPFAAAMAKLKAGKGVLGKRALTRPGARKRVPAQFLDGLRGPGMPTNCDIPRHLLLARGDGGKQALMIVCFQCGKGRLLLPGSAKAHGGGGFSPPRGLKSFLGAFLAEFEPKRAKKKK